jgi:ubiquinone/menaquinone biosynthesis C-methylase UbiE
MGFYDDQVLPRWLSFFMSTKELAQVRARRLEQVEGTVLEVGFGSGLNLPHYRAENVSKLYALDPSTVGLQLAKKRLARVSFPVELLPLRADGRIPLEDSSVDAVVTTWTLCTIPDPLAALREMHRVLRPGGRYYFAEHGLSPDPSVAKWQHRLDPIEVAMAGGCHFTRPIDSLVKDSPLELEGVENFHLSGPRFATYMYFGSAVRA